MIHCPYCNAQFSVAESPRGGCPRCGESLGTAVPTAEAAAPLSVAHASPPPRRRFSNTQLAWGVLAVMAIMASIGLAFALATVNQRRQHDTELPRASRRPVLPPLTAPSVGESVAPAKLSSLGYLPPGCTLVAGLHVEDLLRSPIGERFAEKTLQLGPVELSLASVETFLGIPAKNLDHLVVGSVLEEDGLVSLTPPTVLVLRTREPVGLTRLRQSLEAAAPREWATPDGGKRSVSRGKFRDFPVTLWLPDPHTVVLGLFTDLANVPLKPAADLGNVVLATRQPLEERLGGGTIAWGVVSARKWADSPLLAALPLNPLLLHEGKIDAIQSVVVAVPREMPLRVQMQILADDEAQAIALEQKADNKPDARRKVAREGAWLSLQYRLSEE